MIELAGFWTGSFQGTNQGGLVIELTQQGEQLTGTASVNESLGPAQFSVSGIAKLPLVLRLRPIRGARGTDYGDIVAELSLVNANHLRGKWTSSIGTKGLFEAKRDSGKKESKPNESAGRVFVVHGRDSGSKATVARFLEKLGLEPIILHEQPNRGRTIIEKFESYSDVGFAVVLLTADDVGRLKADSEPLNPRARQNVIFEFGYFIGKIGRDKVCALLEAGVDKPSDLDGIVYVPLDQADAWKMQLVKELKAAGYAVDANKAL